MTLFEAIRELREGQAIVDSGEHSCREGICYRWAWGREGIDEPGCQNYHDYSIVDLPKPKMTLEEGLYEAAEAIPYELLENPSPRQFTKHFVNTLRSLPIDWQAEADRKEGK